jgi:hypothetical protein
MHGQPNINSFINIFLQFLSKCVPSIAFRMRFDPNDEAIISVPLDNIRLTYITENNFWGGNCVLCVFLFPFFYTTFIRRPLKRCPFLRTE